MKKFLILLFVLFLIPKGNLFAEPVDGVGDDSNYSQTSNSDSESRPVIRDQSKTESEKAVDQLGERKTFNQVSKTKGRIYEVPLRKDVVFKLQTALGYVSTIELPEPALKVFVGDQNLFKVGVYDSEVLVKPITEFEQARTNLEIRTEHHRLSFDVSVGSPETADFILDFKSEKEDVIVENFVEKKVNEKTRQKELELDTKEKSLEDEASKIASDKFKEEMLKGGEQIGLKEHQEFGDVRINLVSLSQIGEKGYLRFGVRNLSGKAFKISRAVLGFENFEKTKLGFGKESRGISEIDSRLEIKNPVAGEEYIYGALTFDVKQISKNQTPVFLLFEEEGKRNFRISGFKWFGEKR